MEAGGKTELERAHHADLDRIAAEGRIGLSTPIRPGIEPGSGPAHLSLFSYDPIQYPEFEASLLRRWASTFG